MESKNILVIKHGALGDIILSGGAMKKIRDFHKKDSLFCLTTRPYFDLLKDSPWFDKVLIDKKPKWKNLLGWFELNKELKKYDFYYPRMKQDCYLKEKNQIMLFT